MRSGPRASALRRRVSTSTLRRKAATAARNSSRVNRSANPCPLGGPPVPLPAPADPPLPSPEPPGMPSAASCRRARAAVIASWGWRIEGLSRRPTPRGRVVAERPNSLRRAANSSRAAGHRRPGPRPDRRAAGAMPGSGGSSGRSGSPPERAGPQSREPDVEEVVQTCRCPPRRVRAATSPHAGAPGPPCLGRMTAAASIASLV
jgi:hypothetical protein